MGEEESGQPGDMELDGGEQQEVVKNSSQDMTVFKTVS
jgi:hypothetical protein